MNTHQPPLKPVMDLLEHVRENRVLQISGEPQFSVQSALNILSGIDQEHTLDARAITRTEKIKQMLGWSANPQYSVLSGIDEAALNWAHNEGYFDQPLHVHAAPPIPGLLDPVRITGADNIIIVHSTSNGNLGVLPTTQASEERLLMLFIQATHENLHRTPLLLHQSGLSFDSEQNFNAWGLSVPTQAMDVGTYVLRKNFAEAYASVVLLIGTQGSQEAQSAIKALMQQNDVLVSTWQEGSSVWKNHMGNYVLQNVLQEWRTLSQHDAEYIKKWAQTKTSELFVDWLVKQPLRSTIVSEMVPSFEKRILDVSYYRQTASHTPPGELLNKINNHIQEHWHTNATEYGIVGKISNMIEKVSLVMGKINSEDPVLNTLSKDFNDQRMDIFQHIVDNLEELSAFALSKRVAQYRKKRPVSDTSNTILSP